MSTLRPVKLDDKYLLDEGYAFMTGIQALVRLPLAQRQRDQAAGLHTAGFITGYRGSPLGAYDQQLWRAKNLLDAAGVRVQPAVNEDLAATAIWGAQQARLGESDYDGVFGIWYGKGPGVDRSGDALRHANLGGTAAHGGVVALLGDDHTCESSTTAHQSEYAMVDAMIPVLNPAGVQEILEYGLLGFALSRYSGCWSALKCVHDTVEAAASVRLDGGREILLPEDFTLPEGGLNIRWPDTPLEQERRLHEQKIPAVRAFARANRLDRALWRPTDARVGVVTTGKSYLDVRQALSDLDLDQDPTTLALYKVAMPWPLEPHGLREFCQGLELVIVVEEKRGLMETQVREILYGLSEAPVVIGKHDEQGKLLFPSAGRLDTNHIAVNLGERLLARGVERVREPLAKLQARLQTPALAPPPMVRSAYFCAGCPHNTSTKIPEGSKALAGIGCHYLVQWMERDTARFTQMGAEGASWIGEAPFSRRKHMFQNIGDGTYFHSGLMAVRAAAAVPDINITFKILYNDAVAMTGGQRVDGQLSVADISRQVHAEGAKRVVVVSDEPDKYPPGSLFAPGTTFHHRDELDAVQRQLQEIPGTTVLIYDQTCAAEKRRRRKRGEFPDPPRRVLINELVCEGCGDCGLKSNCVAILPKETEFGRKRAIDQSACNKDFSCLKGFCPSFVTVEGGERRQGQGGSEAIPSGFPEPQRPTLEQPYNLVITGVGGTGVVTIGALLGMAAHLEGKGCSVLDMMGLAQKGGAVLSHLRIAQHSDEITATRVATGAADLLLGGDLVVSAGNDALATLRAGHTRLVVNTREMMTGQFTRHADLNFPAEELQGRLRRAVGEAPTDFIDATTLATELLGDAIASNLFLLGFAYQRGHLPVSAEALYRAIELNGVAVPMNQRAFDWGRLAAYDPSQLPKSIPVVPLPTAEEPLDALIQRRVDFLSDYQNARYANRYRNLVEQVREREAELQLGEQLSRTVARYYFKLMAYKDEYEVARLHSGAAFQAQLQQEFQGDYQLRFHLAPPLLARRDPVTGEPLKREFGGWMMGVFRLLARLRGLRGTPLDIFGYTAERRLERRLIGDYADIISELLPKLSADNHSLACEIAALPEGIRGYGHVKARHLQQVQEQQTALLARFYAAPTADKVAA